MWTYKQCKTMLTHVFKPRWLVLILLSAGNREFRRGREKEKFDEEEREREEGRLSETERGWREKDSRACWRGTKEGIAEIAESDRSPDDR